MGGAGPRLEVAWLPSELEGADLSGRIGVVVDVLRASTTLVTALEAGARRIVPVETVEEAREVARILREGREEAAAAFEQFRAATGAAQREMGLATGAAGEGWAPGGEVLLGGERRGERIEGFDLGNRPEEYVRDRVEGRVLVFTTTNGTRALRRAGSAAEVWVGCFRNLRAVAEGVGRAERPPVIVCAGRQGRVSLDDALCAGHLVRRLVEAGVAALDAWEGKAGGDEDVTQEDAEGPWELADGARAALALAEAFGPPTPEFLAGTAAGRALTRLGFESDLEFAAKVDGSEVVPVLQGGILVARGGSEGGR